VTLQGTIGGPELKYQWLKNDINISGATDQNFIATSIGTYK
jgi:hypothetical protein